MLASLTYPHSRSGACTVTSAAGIWSIAGQLRRQLADALDGRDITPRDLAALCKSVCVNTQTIEIAWDLEHAVHDDRGKPVFGVCETDAESVGTAYVSINGPMLKGRPDLLLSTACHELGHVIMDVPATLTAPAAKRRYRSFTSSAAGLYYGRGSSEWRANEFMGAQLAPPIPLHRELLRCANSESMALVRVPHAGRPTWPVVAESNHPDILAGVIDVLAQKFGVSPRFMEVRLLRYGLINRRKGDLS